MLTLTYGFKKPQTGDNGSVFFPALEGNFQQLNDHTHNGTNSALLPTASLAVTTQAIASGGWSSQGGGTYRQLVTLPGGLQFDAIVISMRDAATGNYINPTIEKVSATTYYVYINDNTLNLTAYYGI